METIWTSEEKAQLDAVLDQLIPPNRERDIPGAGETGVAGYFSEIATKDASFAAQVRMLLTRASGLAGGVTPGNVRQMEARAPDAFRALLTETYKGYYSRPDMRAKVGVGAHPVHPNGYAVQPEDQALLEALTAPVRARGPIFRDPTGEVTV